MEQGIFIESSVINLKPHVLDFLSNLVKKAREVKEWTLTLKKTELAEAGGKDNRTIARYLNELQEQEILETATRRGRMGGTVIRFNLDKIRFNTSDEAMVNTDEEISLAELLESRLPKAPKEPNNDNNPKRTRRTKKQMLEDKLLQDKEQEKIDKLNAELNKSAGLPSWEWFTKTDNPIENYKIFLLSRVYNRYSILFTDQLNAEAALSEKRAANGDDVKPFQPIPQVSSGYDVLGFENIYRSRRWDEFHRLLVFCERNGIDPFEYLSAQFNRSMFIVRTSDNRNKSSYLPFPNSFASEAAYTIYTDYMEYSERRNSDEEIYSDLPKRKYVRYADDIVIRAIRDSFYNAGKQNGFLTYKQEIKTFLNDRSLDVGNEEQLVEFYDMTNKNLRTKNISKESRDVIKKFVLTQSMIQVAGSMSLPAEYILGSEHALLLMSSIKSMPMDKEARKNAMKLALGKLVHPNEKLEVQREKGDKLYGELFVHDEARYVLQLTNEHRGTTIPINQLKAAIKEYGKHLLPVDELSMLNLSEICRVMDGVSEEEAETGTYLDMEQFTQKVDWKLEGAMSTSNIDSFLSELN